MRSALDCLTRAARCEVLACDTDDESIETMLRTLARHWRTLGLVAGLCETGEGVASQLLRREAQFGAVPKPGACTVILELTRPAPTRAADDATLKERPRVAP